VTDLPFLLRSQEDAFGVSLTEFNEQSDKKWSGYLKAAIASSLSLAFNGTSYASRPVIDQGLILIPRPFALIILSDNYNLSPLQFK
jgi:hypothetical protein